MLFDWLVVVHGIEVNPAHAVRGPKHVVKKRQNADEARLLLDSIDTSTVMGLRDRALIALMAYSFARIGAVVAMKVEDYFVQGRRGWVRLYEKGGKRHEAPVHHNIDAYIEANIKVAGLEGDLKGLLFRTVAGKTGRLTTLPLSQVDAYRMIRRRAKAAGIKTRIGNHTFRATGITAYLKNGGKIETAQQIAAHESSRTTGLYDRHDDDVNLDEVERIGI
jgi:integrase/recombinase XerD